MRHVHLLTLYNYINISFFLQIKRPSLVIPEDDFKYA